MERLLALACCLPAVQLSSTEESKHFPSRQGVIEQGTLIPRILEEHALQLQLAYFAAWPTLGTAILFAAMPRNDRLVAVSAT